MKDLFFLIKRLPAPILKLMQVFYVLGVNIRLKLYEMGILKQERLPGKVISIGNLSVGGTGKTPLVQFFAKQLEEGGRNVAVLSRGYGGSLSNKKKPLAVSLEHTAEQVGDEPLMLAEAGLQVVICPDRVESAQLAVELFGADTFVLDDGYQHLRVKRDVNVCVLDLCDPGTLEALPVGRLREPFSEILRADLILINNWALEGRLDVLGDQYIRVRKQMRSLIRQFAPDTPVSHVIGVQQLTSVDGYTILDPISLDDRPIAFCGIGNPLQFFCHLERYLRESIEMRLISEPYMPEEQRIYSAAEREKLAAAQAENKFLTPEEIEEVSKEWIAFPDHHKYTEKDVQQLLDAQARIGAKYLITTSKDAVKLKKWNIPGLIIFQNTATVEPQSWRSLML